MLVVNQHQVEEILTMKACIQVMEEVLKELAAGEAVQHLRSVIPIEKDNLMGLMPGYLRNEEVIGAKVITIYPENHQQGLPSHQGVVLLNDARDGSLKAVMDGTKITAIRTAAVSAVATKVLSKKDSEVLSLLGLGEQARTHLEAMLLVRPIKRVNIWSRNVQKAELFKAELEQKHSVLFQAFEKAEEAVQNADIICTLTASTEPILEGEWVKAGAHVNAVGACKATDRELDSELVRKSLFYADRVESALNESGDYLIPLKEGVIDSNHIVGELGEVLTNKISGRRTNLEITIFESLGLAIEDLAAANFIYEEGVKRKQVTFISM